MNSFDPTRLENFDGAPDERLFGLSQRDVIALTIFPFKDLSPIKIRKDIANQTLDTLPFFRLTEVFLRILARDSELKLTPRGFLPIKIVKELYFTNIIPDDHVDSGIVNSFHEEEILSIHSMRQVCHIAGLVKKRNNKLSLTKKGVKLLLDRIKLLHLILYTHSYEFDIAELDGYSDGATAQYGQHAIFYLLLKYGSEPRPTNFYGTKYLDLFEGLTDNFVGGYSSPIRQFLNCFEIRAFYRFCDWWGFTKTSQSRYGETTMTLVMPGIAAVFEYVRS